VYTTFLAAWVGVRRQLQQVPREVAAAVVAAVQAAQQHEQPQQGPRAGEASQEKEVLTAQLSDLLLEAGGGSGSAGGG
jgi:hypothetical protein